LNTFFKIFTTALFLSAVFMTNKSYCQDKLDKDEEVVRLIYAETVKDADNSVNTTKAIGSVHFEHNETNLYCDSALFFRDQNLIHAYGKVHINQGDTINLFCDSLKYDGNTKISRLQGNVRMRDNAYKLVTDSLEYNGNNSVGKYLRNAVITTIKDDIKLTSVKGYYHANQKTFFFKDSVRVTHPNYSLSSDTLEFRTNTSTAHFHGPTQIFMDSSEVQCNKGIYYTSEQKTQRFTINRVALARAFRTSTYMIQQKISNFYLIICGKQETMTA
jgi:lipopolysaccharide assembly outer membrane protein LptD (OstA)